MAIKCWAPGCNHNNKRDSCRFFRFPKNKTLLKKWLSLLRRDGIPGSGARVCNCHFREGKKTNLPELQMHNVDKLFNPDHLSPQKRRKTSAQILCNSSRSLDQPNTSVASDELRCSQDDVAAATPSCSGTHTLLEAENYLQGLELERKEKLIKSIGRSMSYIQICDSDKYVLHYTGLPSHTIFASLYELIKDIEINYYLKCKVLKIERID
nr:unnamed protein product [Callosobruchus analis]